MAQATRLLRSFFIGTACAVAATASASAADLYSPEEMMAQSQTEFFIELKGGGGIDIVPDAGFTSGVASNGNRLSGDFELGSPFSFGAEAGAIFSNGLRLSVDLAYYSVDPEQANIAFAPGAAQTPNVLAGDITGFMGFANIGYEYQDFGNFRPFIIAGLGFVSAELENVRAPLGPLTGVANSSDTQFAGKLGFGAAYELFDNFSLVGEYNYITTFDDMNFAFTAPGQTTPFAVESNTHRIHVGLRYSFGR